MAFKKVVVGWKVAVLVLLVLAVSTRVSARVNMVDFVKLLSTKHHQYSDPSYYVIKEKRINTGDDERSSGACCNTCVCALSEPPQCSCEDMFLGQERCESCEQCMCTRSNPPYCRCLDVKEFCNPPCFSAADRNHAPHVLVNNHIYNPVSAN
ncbi:hypothetical protein FNV43_RR19916 [Rhamnella rubrinervis]|uniref:Bowman-Birk serine protease inhibitors family domain-containing protein n=1 Tax=Rhamnella rubrinervis TaxID=2594499 RepID=A0A8K0DZE0_9ROSA|nr:hypothetical protein FNV43_RR19916 [Rhamnella rubrinervis]